MNYFILIKLTQNNYWTLLMAWLDFVGHGHSGPKFKVAKASTLMLGC